MSKEPSASRSRSDFDFSPLYLRNHLGWLLVRPTVSLVFFLEKDLPSTCLAVADLIELYISSIPKESLRFYANARGHYMPLKPAQVTKDLKKLRNLPADDIGFNLDYIGEEGFVGPYGILFSAGFSSVQPDTVHYLKIDFPENILDIWSEDRFLEFATSAANSLPFSYGYVNYCFSHVFSEGRAKHATEPLLAQYIGFDALDSIFRTRMKGRCLDAHWIDFLGTKLAQDLGGYEKIKAALKDVDTRKLTNEAVFTRSARFPPIGDTSKGLKDIGHIPTVARFLKPFRCPDPRSSFKKTNTTDWLGRFDELPSQNWDNTERTEPDLF